MSKSGVTQSLLPIATLQMGQVCRAWGETLACLGRACLQASSMHTIGESLGDAPSRPAIISRQCACSCHGPRTLNHSLNHHLSMDACCLDLMSSSNFLGPSGLGCTVNPSR